MEFVDLKAQYRHIADRVDARIRRALEHQRFILGPEVGELEERLAARVGAKYCISCASGTDALLLALLALDIGSASGGSSADEVITSPFTFFATGEMITLAGARPVFVDIEPVTYNLDPAKIEAAITPRTKAILPISLYGQPAEMDAINAIATRHGLAVIEDAAQSFGALYKGRHSGNLSTIGCTSFFPSKPLGCYGDGGACFTNDDALAAAMRTASQSRPAGPLPAYAHRHQRPARHAAGSRTACQARGVRRGADRASRDRRPLHGTPAEHHAHAANSARAHQRMGAVHHRSRRPCLGRVVAKGRRDPNRRALPHAPPFAAGLRGDCA